MKEFTIDGIKYRETGAPLTEGSSIVITRFEGQDIEPTLSVVVDNSDGDGFPYLDRHIIEGRNSKVLDMDEDTYYVVERVETESELPKINVKLVDKSTYTFQADSSAMGGYFIKFTDKYGNVVAQFPISKVMSVVIDKEVDVYEYD